MATADPLEEPKKPQRVISLLGASTETIYRLGLGSKIVGRSHECDYPPQCLSLPCISRPRLDVNAPSVRIDEAVRAHSANGEPVYELDDEVLSRLEPDLIIAQNHCRVCAVTPDDVSKSRTCRNVRQLVVKPSTLDDCLNDVIVVANAMGYPERGIALKNTLETRLDRVRDLVSSLSRRKIPRVALLEWCDPIMGCGYWLPELVSAAGGTAALIESRPDVVVFALCWFGLARAAKEIVNSWGMDKLRESTTCVSSGSGGGDGVFVVDGNYLVNRSGPRVVESVEALAEVLHPELLGHFGHYGTEFLSTMYEAIDMMEGGRPTAGSDKMCPKLFNEKVVLSDSNNKGEGGRNTNKITPTSGPDEAVKMQLGHLRDGEVMKAFGYNSEANRMRWCSSDRFEAVLKSHGDFRRLLSEPANVGEIHTTMEGIATVRVTLPERDDLSCVELLWTMVAECSNGTNIMIWKTEKIRTAH